MPVSRKGVGAGTYTPTLTSVANLDATTAYQCQYMRVRDMVTVSGKIAFDPTANGTLTRIGISLPIASDFGSDEDCAGSGATSESIGANALAVIADATNNRAEILGLSASTTSRAYYFTFTYQVI